MVYLRVVSFFKEAESSVTYHSSRSFNQTKRETETSSIGATIFGQSGQLPGEGSLAVNVDEGHEAGTITDSGSKGCIKLVHSAVSSTLEL
jgi:hypothetical protein